MPNPELADCQAPSRCPLQGVLQLRWSWEPSRPLNGGWTPDPLPPRFARPTVSHGQTYKPTRTVSRPQDWGKFAISFSELERCPGKLRREMPRHPISARAGHPRRHAQRSLCRAGVAPSRRHPARRCWSSARLLKSRQSPARSCPGLRVAAAHRDPLQHEGGGGLDGRGTTMVPPAALNRGDAVAAVAGPLGNRMRVSRRSAGCRGWCGWPCR